MALSTTAKSLVLGARPKTLPAALVPVLVGTAAASIESTPIWWRFFAAMMVSLSLQIATNFVNDYADGDRGVDDNRVGPTRIVAAGLLSSHQVKLAALGAFGVAGIAGLALTVAVGWELIIVGAVSMVAGWAYTGGPRPYGYYGFGELFVFIFFGLVATVGSAYVQIGGIQTVAVFAAIPVGLLAVALLVINNLRDIPGDTESGKRTLAVRLGDRRTRLGFAGLFAASLAAVIACAVINPWAALALVGFGFVFQPLRAVLRGVTGTGLIAVLGQTARAQLVTGLALTLGLVIS